MQLTGAEILIECLKEQDVDTIFGYPGGAVINIYDALYKHQDEIRHILTSHEQGASHAADGYARATGKVGVCLATSGPGATNLVTGIATAYMDSVPMVAITGNVPLALLGKDSFQEVDITGITMPITKHNFIVKNVKDLASTVRRAFYIAQEGRPGPVLVDIPKDITAQITEYIKEEPIAIEKVTEYITEEDINNALELLQNSQQPLIYVGGGVICADANGDLVAFAEKVKAPVCCTLMGLGGFPATHELFTGMIGMHGTKSSNLAATKCDLLIAIGARFSDRVISKVEAFAPNAQVLHIDIDPAEINKNIRSHYHIIGDVKEVLKRLNKKLAPQENQPWMEQVKTWKEKYPLGYKKDGRLKPQYVIEKIYEMTKGEAIITTEVGQNQMWTAQYYKFTKSRTFISSGGLGTMGYGLGACIGAKIGNPEKLVINVAGDGSFQMNSIELATAIKYNLPIIVVILNNGVLGMVRQWQDLFYDKRYAETDLDRGTDLIKLVEAYGAKGYQITEESQFEEAFHKALESNVPVVLNCIIDKTENVYPMVPAGAPIENVITEG
ncbi:biosynthetic-type acetolactate synthase large subunit [Clostridium formicaceticum]|uniref:Acetolactate synthase n=1 Tax=Clostridium formicaceticum TaxID=1497 RepID=A0AAC9RJA6_9CLOT|nr:biosynthetic-type acetolactate synthase large subunit [Clostridium formicaceticum]AOY76375.1 acetolactate synthase, large subunit, biosynthetic type [Clostridium formicaceticum]ARE86767.1 Acetolactate synthase large subunit [Clostridium formicaceticum]